MPRSEDPPEVAIVVARLEVATTGLHVKLDEIHDEVRQTNGRVTALEKSQAVAVALEAKNVSNKDGTLKLLLAFVAVGTWVTPLLLHFIK
jgi:hypothetical protein